MAARASLRWQPTGRTMARTVWWVRRVCVPRVRWLPALWLVCMGTAAFALPLGLEGRGSDARHGAGVAPTPRDQALFDRPAYPADATPAAPTANSSRRQNPDMLGIPGMASVYHRRLQGRPTASGEPYANEGWTAAHRELPLGTLLSVRNPANGVEVVVRVNDRGPFHPGRMVDLSVAAAQALGLMQAGVAMVVIRPLLSEEADSRSLGVQDAGTYPGQLPR